MTEIASPPIETIHRQWGQNLRARLEQMSYSQERLARDLGVSQKSVSRWVRGQSGPSDRHKIAIAKTLRIDVRTLFPLVWS